MFFLRFRKQNQNLNARTNFVLTHPFISCRKRMTSKWFAEIIMPNVLHSKSLSHKLKSLFERQRKYFLVLSILEEKIMRIKN